MVARGTALLEGAGIALAEAVTAGAWLLVAAALADEACSLAARDPQEATRNTRESPHALRTRSLK